MSPCVSCKSPIEPKATKCPHCLGWQSRILPDPQSPWGIAAILSPVFLFVGVFFYEASQKLDEIAPPKPATENVRVAETTLQYSDCCNGSRYVAIVGFVENANPVAAQSPHFEAKFYNASGDLIDSLATDSYDLVIGANAKASFRVRGPAQHSEDDYASHEVVVTHVRPVSARF